MTDPATTIVFGMLIIFLAGFTHSLTGFGFALVAVPLLMIFLPPQAVVPIQLLLASLTGIVVVYEARQWVRLKQIWPLMLAGIIGIPLGTYLLTVLDTNVLKIFIGAVISLSALAFLFGFQRPIRNERLASAPIGFISGVLNGSTGMSGPPVILFFSNQDVEKRIFRVNLATYFLVLNAITFPTQWIGGLLTREVFTYALWFLPALALGSWAGIKLSHRIREDLFRKIALVIVAIAGMLSVITGLGIL